MGLQVVHMEVRVIWWILQNQKNLRQLTRSGSVLLRETVRDEHIHMCVKNFFTEATEAFYVSELHCMCL